MFKPDSYIRQVNAKHADIIQKLCLEHLRREPAPPRPAQIRREGNRDVAQDDRDLNDLGELLKIPEGRDHVRLSIAEVLASANLEHSKLLEPPWYVEEQSNKDTEVSKFLLTDTEQLLKIVPFRTKSFELLAEQRMAILTMVTPVPNKIFVKLHISRESMALLTQARHRKQEFTKRLWYEQNQLGPILLADYATGAGKTAMALLSAFIMLICPQKWADLQKHFYKTVASQRLDPYSGLHDGEYIETMRLARLCIAYVPPTLQSHWEETARDCLFGIRETFGPEINVNIWRGIRGGTHCGGASILQAYESAIPTLWILPMQADSLHVEQKPSCRNIMYAVRIMDELNCRLTSQTEVESSCPLHTLVTQATIKSLTTCTKFQPRHPVRRALGDQYRPMHEIHEDIRSSKYKSVAMRLEHLAKIRMFAASGLVRRAVSNGIQRNMPSGLNIYELGMRISTVANVVFGGTMDMSFGDLVAEMLGRSSSDWKENVKTLLNYAAVLDSGEILKKLDDVLENMPVANLSDQLAKNSITRLATRLKEVFTSELPEDPVTFEKIERPDVRILACCTAIISRTTIPHLNSRCPLCRKPLHAVEIAGDPSKVPDATLMAAGAAGGAGSSGGGEAGAAGVAGASDDQVSPSLKRPAPSSANGSSGKAVLRELDEDDADGKDGKGGEEDGEEDAEEDAKETELEAEPTAEELASQREEEHTTFLAKVRELTANNLHAVEAIMRLLKFQCEVKPSSRVLLCLGFEKRQKQIVRSLVDRMEKEIARACVTDIDNVARDYTKGTEAIQRYLNVTRFENPQILLVNTRAQHSTVQGYNLHTTDLTVVDSQCEDFIQRQAAGRCLRMQPLINGRLFGPKNLVVLKLSGYNGVPFGQEHEGGNMEAVEENARA